MCTCPNRYVNVFLICHNKIQAYKIIVLKEYNLVVEKVQRFTPRKSFLETLPNSTSSLFGKMFSRLQNMIFVISKTIYCYHQ